MDLLTLGYIVASLAILVELLILAILIKRVNYPDLDSNES